MNMTIDQRGTSIVALVESSEVQIREVQDALDMMANVRYAHDCNKIVIWKESLTEDFFELRTKLAGDILQKFTNYQVKLAIIGDFSHYDSKSLRDFIYECNHGHHFFFVADEQAALDALHGV